MGRVVRGAVAVSMPASGRWFVWSGIHLKQYEISPSYCCVRAYFFHLLTMKQFNPDAPGGISFIL